MNKLKRFSFFALQVILCGGLIFAIEFEFEHTTGHTYRILSTTEQEVFVDDEKTHDAIIATQISVMEREALADGSARIETTYETSEDFAREGEQPRYAWGQEYFSSFTRSRLGVYTIPESAFMPVVRDLPIFPDYDVQPGDTWTAEGEEAHDMRLTFSMKDPLKVPFTSNYTYKGTERIDGKTFHVILVDSNLFFEIPADGNQNIPISITGNSNQTLYWDIEIGFWDHYTETYDIAIKTTFGNKLAFKGSTQAEVTDFEPREVNEYFLMVQDQIAELEIEDATVHVAEKGITISLENIQFEAESDILLSTELVKLQKIAEILVAFPENDLLISGHTALAGTTTGRQKLSEDRASAVADYFAELGVRRHEQLFTKGFGADEPIAPNDTPQNKARNRRVEITIMN